MDEYVDDEQPGKPLYEYVRSMFEVIGALWKERRKLFRRTVMLMALTLGCSCLLPNRYTAIAVLTPPDSEPMSGLDMLISAKTGMTQLASSQVGDMLGMRSPGQLYIMQMLSRPVQDRLIDRFDLKTVYRTGSPEKTRKALTAATVAEEDRKSGAIKVSVTDKSPKRAADLANAYAEELGLLISKVNADSAKKEREYFENQLQQAKDELQQDTRDLAAFGIKNGTVDTGAEGSALVSATATIEGDILATESEIKGLLQIYTPQHERVLAAQAKLAELRKQIQQLKGKVPADAVNGTDTLREVLGVSPEYMALDHKVKIQEAVVESLAQQFELSKLQEMHKVGNVQVFDPAIAPERKSAPHRAAMTLFLGIVFLFVQSMLIIARNAWRSLPADDPWRITLQPAMGSMYGTVTRFAKVSALGNHNFLARSHKRRTEKHDLTEPEQQ
jgi:uncharacterized protein involved in exopolysaccharide biosynthesis